MNKRYNKYKQITPVISPIQHADSLKPTPPKTESIPRVSSTTTYLVTQASDEKLVLSAKHGDEKAFNTLLYRHRPDAYKLAYKILYKPNGRINAKQSADDVLQEASLRAWKYIRANHIEIINFRAWFRSIVRSECKNLFKDLTKDFANIDIYTDVDLIEDFGTWMVGYETPMLMDLSQTPEELARQEKWAQSKAQQYRDATAFFDVTYSHM